MPFARVVITPLGALVVAGAGVVLAWRALKGLESLEGVSTSSHWRPWRAWPVWARIGIVSCGLWAAMLALDLRGGHLRNVFGVYLALSNVLWIALAGGKLTVPQVRESA
ncbi:MAG: hypothetical protein V4813_15065 [Gemmatimonadota bacterium]